MTDEANAQAGDCEGKVVNRRVGLSDDENLVAKFAPVAHDLSRGRCFTRARRALNKGQRRSKARRESGTLRRIQFVGQNGGGRIGARGEGMPEE